MQEKTNTQVEEQKKYTYPGGKAEAGRNRLISLGFTAALTVVFLLVGSYACMSMGREYIFLPWMFIFPAIVGCWLAVIKLFLRGEFLTEKEIPKGPGRMWRSSFLVALLSGIATGGCVWYLFDGGYTSLTIEIGFLIRIGILCALALVSMRLHKKQESRLVEVNH